MSQKSPCRQNVGASRSQCQKINCNFVSKKNGSTYCRSSVGSGQTKRLKRSTKCQNKINASDSKCKKLGCATVKTKNGTTYCKSHVGKGQKKSPLKSNTVCQNNINASKEACATLGCNFVKTKKGSTYCRTKNTKTTKTKIIDVRDHASGLRLTVGEVYRLPNGNVFERKHRGKVKKGYERLN